MTAARKLLPVEQNPSTLRSHLTRQRKAAGRIILTIELNELDHVEFLIRAGLLKAWDEPFCRAELKRATEMLLAALHAEGEGG